MNLVGQILQLPPIEAFTSRGTPITIGNNKDRYRVIDHTPASNSADGCSYTVVPLLSIIPESTFKGFIVMGHTLESAIGEDNE